MPHAQLIVSIVATAIVVTLLLQATTAGWLARRLRLAEGEWAPNTGEPAHVATPT